MPDSVLGWLALLVIGASTAEWFRRARAVALGGSRAPYVAAWALGAGGGIVALMGSPGLPGGVAAGVAAFAGLLFLGLFAISRQAVAPGAVKVGDRLRDFTALDEHGDPFTLSSTFGHPILIKFFRGHW
jgi:hypothetical protein